MNKKSNKNNCPTCYTLMSFIKDLVYYLIVSYSVYLNFKCNQKFDFWSCVIACVFAPFYIIYMITKNFCNK